MKTLALTTALVVALSAPAAFASASLARSLDVEPGQLSTVELIQLRNAVEDNDTNYVNFLLNSSSNPVEASVAFDARLRSAIEDQDTNYEAFLRSGGREVISTQGTGHSLQAQAIFDRIRAESLEDE
ncbi:hypothetical protein DZD18_01710 [Rhodobacteraceae bacterium W635]|uniref:hypothetical protein n=1 Tax=Nioella halotolerans TaxID=2303578 RepID=UPI000E3C88BD|nr:hypothetical protein DZD18_01710 [Rhodobacteraceae bacterium W635]